MLRRHLRVPLRRTAARALVRGVLQGYITGRECVGMF